MLNFEYAETPDKDSVAYVLLNTQWCEPSMAERKLTIAYNRFDDPVEATRNPRRDFTFDEIDAAHPGLTEALIEIFPDADTASNIQSVMANSLASFIFNNYVDLRLSGPISTKYSCLSKAFSVTSNENEGHFVISGSCFNVLEVVNNGIPKLEVRSYTVQSINTAQLESIWPGSSTVVPMMEALGYSPYEIGGYLNRNRGKLEPTSAVVIPDFDAQ